MEDLKTRLIKDMAEVEWQDLIPHAKRDAIIIVNENLDLLEVGLAIAQDQVNSVQHWMAEELIGKPSVEQLNTWNIEPSKLFKSLILQPFILVQSTIT
ncbi:DUF2288 domain-containing protein [Aphanothece sacrum]|uniref:DUF2288 domain-containing protein n=1 Tax=Aphanothece sacrum FPU1 TaxID=1920663 RepID=A0A401IN48_APHSA|nr:DUF2288 domain-containing protein [Aphanothece sacrum]GBF82690.1 hypothetical protein AsFPU1_4123 [Aphanothece sacrum FPU1]GBF84518.1 hypothetical protein AsFPU3_1568 [Aphanothece sacrum FPU3]